MWITVEGVQEYANWHGFDEELDISILRTVAKNLAERWESDYDYVTFMEDGVLEELEMLGVKKNDQGN